MPFNHQLRVRYGECDQQGVVFNANYLAYIDDASEVWIRSNSPNLRYEDLGWEWMVVKSIIEWHSPARTGDLLDMEIGVTRYGQKSFDLGTVGTVASRKVFSAKTICVSVKPVTHEPIVTPEHVLSILGDVVELDIPDG